MRSSSPLLIFAFCVVGSGCESEESSSAGVTRPTHEQFFLLTSGRHADASCESCHDASESFSSYVCTGCHAAATTRREHPDGGHFEYRSQSCYACHPRGDDVAFDHEAVFPVLTGASHDRVSCEQCHGVRADKTVFVCTSCHARQPTGAVGSGVDAMHSQVAKYAWSSPACFGCHPKGR